MEAASNGKLLSGSFRLMASATIAMLIVGFANHAPAAEVTISAVGDTYITEHANPGGPTSTHGSDSDMWLIRGTGVFRTFPLIQFDLAPFSGMTIGGDTSELRLNLIDGWHHAVVAQSVSVRTVLTEWAEGTTSWASFGGTGFNETAHTGVNLTTRTVTFTGEPESILFTIPSSVVQGWIDAPATNYGLILISNTVDNQQDLVFGSREGNASPTLSFHVLDTTPIPAPAAMLLGTIGAGVVGWLRRRRAL